MLEVYSPIQLLSRLESSGYRLRVKDGKLFGPPGMSAEFAAMVKEHKEVLITLITFQCPRCNQPVRTNLNTPNVLYIECSHDPSHFGLAMPKRAGMPMHLTTRGFKPAQCVQCGKPNDSEWKYCAKCWLGFFEEEERAASGSEL